MVQMTVFKNKENCFKMILVSAHLLENFGVALWKSQNDFKENTLNNSQKCIQNEPMSIQWGLSY